MYLLQLKKIKEQKTCNKTFETRSTSEFLKKIDSIVPNIFKKERPIGPP